jgi:hypothetical protein
VRGRDPGDAEGRETWPDLAWLIDQAQRIVEAALPAPASRLRHGRLQILGIGWATVELDRAARELRPGLGLLAAAGFRDGGPDPLLGARSRLAGDALAGPVVVLLEPATEGRLAAFLARQGEGIAAVYVARPAGTPAGNRAGALPASGRGSSMAAWDRASGPLGPQRWLAGGRFGPWTILVDDTAQSPGSAAAG